MRSKNKVALAVELSIYTYIYTYKLLLVIKLIHYIYEGDSIYNEIALITPPTHGLELYAIYGMKDQGFTFRMVHKTLFYHSYLSSYRL